MQTDTFKNNAIWNTTGSLTYALSQWLIIVVIAKIGTPEMVGEYSLALAITAPITMFLGGKLRLIYVTDHSEFSFADYLNYKYLSSLLAILLIIIIVGFTSYNYSVVMIILLIGLFKIHQDISELLYGVFQKQLKMKFIGISKIIKALMMIVLFTITLYYSNSLILAVLSIVIVSLLILLIYDLKFAKRFVGIRFKINFITIKDILLLSLPLSIMTLLNSLATNVPRYIIEMRLDLSSLGYFSALLHLIFAGNILIDSLRQPIIPILVRNYRNKNRKNFIKIIAGVLLLCFIISFIGLITAYIFGETLLTIAYSADYAEFNDMFIIMILASGFIYGTLILDSGINAARKFKIQPFIGLLWLVSSIIISFYFITAYGLIGAALGLLIYSFFKFLTFLALLISILGNKHWADF
ncbi:oligosaccharide flippase family protein [Sporosarcina pasteurii]|uniref:Polysaccharide biosynthesis protein n=1 Tax=Sporosarcina pasteurii TaxID=1474 RepID=A0A380BCX1_SPOPA|nr:oligosaccharide flippase family protein [Sporosarcina pasteurii]MDS9472211.1 oligosaccharide flippase family protein [Sporosarcina pasteurii]SUI99196.1 Polysaccharide biosynthesis protein [Sporosarcina pasteurii]